MAKGQRRDPAREAKWRQVLAQQARSGLSVRAFCRREGLPESAWYAWRRTIRERDAAGGGQRSAARPAFVPLAVRPEGAASDAQAVLELRGGRVLRLPAWMPPAQLAALVHAIEKTGDAA